MSKEYTYEIDKYTIGVDENGEDGIGLTIAIIKNGEINCLDNCYGEKARCIDLLIKENQELKKQLEEYQEELEKADSITQSCIFNGKKESEISYRKCLNMLEKHKNQQKKFIEYLENEKDRLARECSQIYEDSLGKTRLVNEDTFNEVDTILSKYKEIIGGKE